MSGKFDSKSKSNFLKSLPVLSLDSGLIIDKCKFNFSFFDGSQPSGQGFSDWSHPELVKLLDKLKNYSESSLDFWRNQRAGGGGLKILEVYGTFPKRSDFIHPKHVPHDVLWARFRMENKVRLIGFLIPKTMVCNDNKAGLDTYDYNTFYVVFLDKDHKFYLTEDS